MRKKFKVEIEDGRYIDVVKFEAYLEEIYDKVTVMEIPPLRPAWPGHLREQVQGKPYQQGERS